MEGANKAMTLGYPVRDDVVYLARKKKKLCMGKLNGYGGRIENENSFQCMQREFFEESGASVDLGNLSCVGNICFWAGASVIEARLVSKCAIFLIKNWSGDMVETDEMGPPIEFRIDELPFSEMMAPDHLWLKNVLLGKNRVSGSIYLSTDMSLVIASALIFKQVLRTKKKTWF